VVKLLTNNSAEREFSEENHLGIAQLPANHFMRLTSNLSEAFGNRRLGFTQELGIGSFAVFAEGEIGGTPCMRSHILVHSATNKICANSFIFKNKIEKEGLLRDSPAGLGAGGPEFKSRLPDQNIPRVFFSLLKARFTQNSPVEFRQTGRLDLQVV